MSDADGSAVSGNEIHELWAKIDRSETENDRLRAEIAILRKVTLLTDSQIKALLDAVVDIAEAVK